MHPGVLVVDDLVEKTNFGCVSEQREWVGRTCEDMQRMVVEDGD